MNSKIVKFLILVVIIIGIILFVINLKPAPPAPSYVPQFVLISFDGSNSVDTWKDLREFKEEMKRQNKTINFTHFINAAYFLIPENRDIYQGPDREIGKTNIGVAKDVADVNARIEEVNMAIADGDEIASHTTGHFSGLSWTKEQWKEEFASFDKILFAQPKLNLTRKDIIGFRAPYLDKNLALFEALHEENFKYDTSEIDINDSWPTKDEKGMWRIKMGMLNVRESKSRVLAMDYNLYFRDTKAKDLFKKGTAEWQTSYDNYLAAFLEYFDRNYSENRAPVLVGYHFSQSWNDGVYWEVMKEFSRQVCGKPEVRCGTFRELVGYMEEGGVPKN